MRQISQAVGNDCPNIKSDVMTVQELLNGCINQLIPYRLLKTDGICGSLTISMIVEFQKRVVGMKNPDGRIDPGKTTIKKLNELYGKATQKQYASSEINTLFLGAQLASNNPAQAGNTESSSTIVSKLLSETDYVRAANALGVEVAVIKAVAKIESAGNGFLSSGKPKILFEGHIFSKQTKGIYDKKHPTISYPKWTKAHYKGGEEEYKRYTLAESLDKQAAQKSTSWGKFQIMGFNHGMVGYATVDGFVKAMYVSEGKQLDAFVQFVKAKKLDVHLKSKNWASFAKGYNGAGYAQNQYDIKMKQAYEAFSVGKK